MCVDLDSMKREGGGGYNLKFLKKIDAKFIIYKNSW